MIFFQEATRSQLERSSRQTSSNLFSSSIKLPFTLMFLSAMGKDESVYPEPNKCKPERWMGKNSLRYNPFEFPVFHAGPRVCLGNQLALLETKLCVAETLLRYRFRMAEEVPAIPYRVGIPLKFTGRLDIQFQKR